MNGSFGPWWKKNKHSFSQDEHGNLRRCNTNFDKHFNQVQRGIKIVFVGIIGWLVGPGVLGFIGWVVYKLLEHNGVF